MSGYTGHVRKIIKRDSFNERGSGPKVTYWSTAAIDPGLRNATVHADRAQHSKLSYHTKSGQDGAINTSATGATSFDVNAVNIAHRSSFMAATQHIFEKRNTITVRGEHRGETVNVIRPKDERTFTIQHAAILVYSQTRNNRKRWHVSPSWVRATYRLDAAALTRPGTTVASAPKRTLPRHESVLS